MVPFKLFSGIFLIQSQFCSFPILFELLNSNDVKTFKSSSKFLKINIKAVFLKDCVFIIIIIQTLAYFFSLYMYISVFVPHVPARSGPWVNKELKLKINCTIGILKNVVHVYFGNELNVKISCGSSSRRTHAGIIRYVIGVDNFHVGVCGLQTNSFGTPRGLLMPADADQIVCP